MAMDIGSKPTTMLIEDWDKLDRKERSMIHLSLLDSLQRSCGKS